MNYTLPILVLAAWLFSLFAPAIIEPLMRILTPEIDDADAALAEVVFVGRPPTFLDEQRAAAHYRQLNV